MRVLHITPMYPTESNPGFGAFVKSQIESLKEHVDIELLVLPGMGGIRPYIKAVPVIREKLKEEFDIVHVHFGHVSTLVKMVRPKKTPLVTSYCGTDLLGKVSAKWIERFKGQIFSDQNIKYSKYDDYSIVKTEELAAKIRTRTKNLEIIPNGVDTGVFKGRDRNECRVKLGLDLDRPVVLFPADPENKVKNFELLRDALAKLEDLKIQLISFDKNNKVAHKQVADYMNAADLVVLTSFHEGSSNVVKETMACNGRVISTDVGDCKWLLEGVKGSSIARRDSSDLAELIRNALEDKSGLSNSREVLFEKKLDAESIALRIFEVYNKVVKNT